ncbi:MAG: hypothetical protein IKJ73_00285 [Lachnospiraceae bacterium]|nr:hypothetical protein [Lachnospiraceae bacterium]
MISFLQNIGILLLIPLLIKPLKTLNTYINNSVNLPEFTLVFSLLFFPFFMIALWPFHIHFSKNVPLSDAFEAFIKDMPFYGLIIFIIMLYFITSTFFTCILYVYLLKRGTRIKGTIESSTLINTYHLQLIISWKNPFTAQTQEVSTVILNSRRNTFDYQYIFAPGDQVPIYISSTFQTKSVIDFRY